MKLRDARDAFYGASGTASGIVRSLALAAIGLVWILREDAHTPTIPHALLVPAFLVVLALALDLLQYLVVTATWGFYARLKEKQGAGEEDEFLAPRGLNWAPLSLFTAKSAVMAAGYCMLLAYIWSKYV